jgi:hypothetical protein
MLLSALVVALGFSALALADSAPMRFFGILTALSVSGAAVLALLLGPALLPPHGLARLRARALESAQMAAPLAKPSEKKR